MKKIITLALVALTAISISAQKTRTEMRGWVDGDILCQKNIEKIDSITFVEIVEPEGQTYVDGVLPGIFSVSATKRVHFSQGNLQYQASNDMWRFAENQYDYIGDAEEEIKCDNALISPEYYGWIDLFGWGTATNPTLTSTSNSDYATFTDWGINAISNGGNEPNKWRTLTYDEWYYLMYTRVHHDNLQGQAEVNGVHGYIFLPDNWSAPSGLTFQASPNDWTTNQYADSEWLAMEASGALFLPCAGIREGVTINEVGLLACYVSSTPSDKTYVYCVFFREDWAYAPGASKHYVGQSVRLAQEL